MQEPQTQTIALADHIRALRVFYPARAIYQAAVALLLAEEGAGQGQPPPVAAPAPAPAPAPGLVTTNMLIRRLRLTNPVIRSTSDDAKVEAAARALWREAQRSTPSARDVERELLLAGVDVGEVYEAIRPRRPRDWSHGHIGGRLAAVLNNPAHLARVQADAERGRTAAKVALTQAIGRPSTVRAEAHAHGMSAAAVYRYLRDIVGA